MSCSRFLRVQIKNLCVSQSTVNLFQDLTYSLVHYNNTYFSFLAEDETTKTLKTTNKICRPS